MADRTLTAKSNGGIAFAASGSDYETEVDLTNLASAGALADADLLIVSQSGAAKAVAFSSLVKSYRTTFTDGDLAAGVLTVTHNLGEKYVAVTVWDNEDREITVDVTPQNTTSLEIDLSGYGSIMGTWNVLVKA